MTQQFELTNERVDHDCNFRCTPPLHCYQTHLTLPIAEPDPSIDTVWITVQRSLPQIHIRRVEPALDMPTPLDVPVSERYIGYRIFFYWRHQQ